MIGAVDAELVRGVVGATTGVLVFHEVGTIHGGLHHLGDGVVDGRLVFALVGGLEQLELLVQRSGSADQVGGGQDVVRVTVLPADGERLGPFRGLAYEGGVESLHRGEHGVVVHVRVQLAAWDDGLDQALDPSPVQARDLDDRVQATRTQHALVDALQVVGGHDDHQLATLGGDAVEGVEQLGDLAVGATAGLSVDVLHEHDRGLVELGGLQDVLDVIPSGTGRQERPPVLVGDLGDDQARRGLAGPVGAVQQSGALDLDALLHHGFSVLDDREHGALQDLLDVLGEHDLAGLEPAEVHELQVVGAGHGLAAVDAAGLEFLLDLVEQELDLTLELLHQGGVDLEDLAVLLVRMTVAEHEVHTLEARDGDLVPGDVDGCRGADLHRPSARGILSPNMLNCGSPNVMP